MKTVTINVFFISPTIWFGQSIHDDGSLIESFGKGGYIDLKENHVWDTEDLEGEINQSSPAITYKDHLILDTNPHEGRTAAPGNMRSFNTITGEFEWRFHTIPQEGQLGYDTWEWEENMIYGGANSWGGFTVDEERGWVFAATGSATGGIHGGGGARPGKNLFANCVLAINAETGELQWYFQTMHHDIWDYDIAPPPMLSYHYQRWRGKRCCGSDRKTGEGICSQTAILVSLFSR
ncbi:MAG: hypothetical protein U5K69_23230 [Balneolaceae bacterium]|nr:hypothetical protein [Balneolaceae bacterium]